MKISWICSDHSRVCRKDTSRGVSRVAMRAYDTSRIPVVAGKLGDATGRLTVVP
jgi:hypothetical protein